MVRYVSKIWIDDSFSINWNVSRINKYHFDFHTAFTMKSIEKRTSWLFRFVPSFRSQRRRRRRRWNKKAGQIRYRYGMDTYRYV